MVDETNVDMTDANVAEAVIQRKRGVSIIWLIPMVAAVIGVWLFYRAAVEKGPTITIAFEKAEGLSAGKTKIKYKDVEVGSVSRIQLSPNLSHVIVTAELAPECRRYLTEDTKFWVVTARVTAGEVSGLSTLLSGAYIGMEPGRTGMPTSHFKGLAVAAGVGDEMNPGGIFICGRRRWVPWISAYRCIIGKSRWARWWDIVWMMKMNR